MVAACLAISIAGGRTLPSETDRLVSTGKLWITVKYFDPVLAYRDIDWDQALVQALPKIRAAQTPADYEAAVRSMMQVVETNPPVPSSTGGQRVWIHHGLPPENTNSAATPFYSAFLYKPTNTIETVHVPMGGFSVDVPLSEPANAGTPIPPMIAARTYADSYPSTELRILAAYKVWGVLHYFFAYRDLIDEDWDGLLLQYLPRVIAAKDALEYNLTIAEWLTHAADTFTAPRSSTLTQYFGEAPVGLRLRVVEKHVMVTEVLDHAAVQAGIKVGDVVKTVDGETLVNRFKPEEQYVSASTPQRLTIDVVARILNGPDESNALLTLEDPAGHRKEVTLKRSKHFLESLQAPPPGETTKLLRNGIGYADLTRLKASEVDAMFEKFRSAAAIIFDMRGEPAEDTIPAVAARLATESDLPGAIVTGPVLIAPDWTNGLIASQSSSYFFIETVGNSSQWKYKNRTAMLVDERTSTPVKKPDSLWKQRIKPNSSAHRLLAPTPLLAISQFLASLFPFPAKISVTPTAANCNALVCNRM